MLSIVCCHFNPAGFTKPRENFLKFRDLLGVPVTVVEASFDGRFYCDPDIAIAADVSRQVLWQKERLLNLGLSRLPRSADRVAWIDADVRFLNPDWQEQAEEALDRSPIVQLFESAEMLGPRGDVVSRHLGKVAGMRAGRQKTALKTGFAWAARRDAIGLDLLSTDAVQANKRCGGLFDLDVVGGGDSSMVSAWSGRRNDWLVRHMNREFRTAFKPWAIDAWRRCRGQLGFVPGTVQHMYHGDLRNRRYGHRIQPLCASRFTPRDDLALGENGLWSWASNKPALHEAVAAYFRCRREDM